jgi:hypothetical protein
MLKRCTRPALERRAQQVKKKGRPGPKRCEHGRRSAAHGSVEEATKSNPLLYGNWQHRPRIHAIQCLYSRAQQLQLNGWNTSSVEMKSFAMAMTSEMSSDHAQVH